MSTWDKGNEVMMATHGTGADGKPRTCLVCGKEPDAIWVGAGVVTVCRVCAIEVLPQLMADAVAPCSVEGAGAKVMDGIKFAWVRAEGRYWRSLANSLAMLGGRRKPSSDGSIFPDEPDEGMAG